MCAKIKNNKNTLPEVPAGFVYSYIFLAETCYISLPRILIFFIRS